MFSEPTWKGKRQHCPLYSLPSTATSTGHPSNRHQMPTTNRNQQHDSTTWARNFPQQHGMERCQENTSSNVFHCASQGEKHECNVPSLVRIQYLKIQDCSSLDPPHSSTVKDNISQASCGALSGLFLFDSSSFHPYSQGREQRRREEKEGKQGPQRPSFSRHIHTHTLENHFPHFPLPYLKAAVSSSPASLHNEVRRAD